MKKIVMMLATVAVLATACQDDEMVISEGELPSAARDFIETHFPDATVTRVIKDTEGSTEYDVNLDNGFSLEFDKSGNWREVDGNGVEVPASILAEIRDGIVTYIETNHNTQAISTIELNKSTYEISTIGGLEIIFDLEGNFIRYDD